MQGSVLSIFLGIFDYLLAVEKTCNNNDLKDHKEMCVKQQHE